MGERKTAAGMKKKGMITIRSSRDSEFDSEVETGGEKYLVQTEKGGPRNPLIMTRIYFKGRIISSTEINCRDLMNNPELENRIYALMRRQHQSAINALKAEKIKAEKTPSDYLEEVRDLVKRNRKGDALAALVKGLERFPDNLFLLSYRGYLDATVNKRYREGIADCNRAIEMLRTTVPFGEEFFYPLLYLNLGMACIAAGRKRDAIKAFHKGLEIDSENGDLHKGVKKLGIRRRLPIPFFGRSHLLNRYLGLLFHKLKK